MEIVMEYKHESLLVQMRLPRHFHRVYYLANIPPVHLTSRKTL